MVDVAQDFLDEISKIRAMVEGAYSIAKDNVDTYDEMRQFLFITTLNDDVLNACEKFGWPKLELNTLEANVSRLAGEYAKQMLGFAVRSRSDSISGDLADFVEGRLRYTFGSPDMENLGKAVFMECLSGGFSAAKIVVDYADPYTFEQDIMIEKCFDPTLVYFDPMARKNHKGDGEFCFEFIPMTKDAFKEKYPDFDLNSSNFTLMSPTIGNAQVPWFAKEQGIGAGAKGQQIIYVCHFYKKKLVEKTLVGFSLPDGKQVAMIKEDFEEWAEKYEKRTNLPGPSIKIKRQTMITEVWCYKFVKDKYLEEPYKEPFRHLPIVQFDGNSQIIKGKTNTRPYHYQAVDAQKLTNMTAIAMANGIESMNNTQFMMCEESLPTSEQDRLALRSPQKQQGTLIYKAYPQTNMPQPNPPPIIIPKSSFDPVLLQALQSARQMQQECLGNFNTTLGLNQGEINQIAVEESITQSNATAMPFLNNFTDSMNQLALIYVDLLPNYFKTPRSVPIIDKDGFHKSVMINDANDPNSPMVKNYESLDLAVSVKADVNFNLQKDRAVGVIQNLMKESPRLAKFFGAGPGLTNLLDNVDMRGIENIRKKAIEWMDQEDKNDAKMQQQMMQMNPEVIKKQVADQDFSIKQMQLALEKQKIMMEAQIEKMKLQESQLETIAKIRDTEAKTEVATIKGMAEMKRAQIDQSIAIDQHLSEKVEKDREHLSNMLDLSIKHMHNTNQHTQAIAGLALDAKAAQNAQQNNSEQQRGEL